MEPVPFDLPGDPLFPLGLGIVRSIWRFYLDPDTTLDGFRSIVDTEFASARPETARIIDAWDRRLREITANALREQGDEETARRVESNEMRFENIDRMRDNLLIDGKAMQLSAEVLDLLRAD